MTIGSSQDWLGHTFNMDLIATSTALSFNWPRYRDDMLGSSTWGHLPADAGFLTFLREGQALDLPTGGPSASWTPAAYFADLMSSNITPWCLPLGRKIILGDFPLALAGGVQTSDGALDLKWKTAKLCGQTTVGFIKAILGVNEPERPGVTNYNTLGASATAVMNALAWVSRIIKEQLKQSATGTVTSFSTVPTRSSDILIASPVYAEPIRNPTVASSKVSLDRLFQNTDFLQNTDLLSVHHHQGMGNYACFPRFNGTAPLDATVCIYHMWDAYLDASASKTMAFIADESGHHMGQPVGNLFGWGATVGNYEIMDELRYLRIGAMVAGMLQYAPIVWCGYAHETGASDYLYDRQGGAYTPYDSWAYHLELSDYRNYSTNDTPAGVIPIHAKGSTDLSDLRTIACRINTNTAPASSYGSATPPFLEWQRSSFNEGLIRGTSGSTKYYERAMWLESTAEYTFRAECRVVGSTQGACKLRVSGYNNTFGSTYVESTALFGNEGWSTMEVAFTVVNHNQSSWGMPDPSRGLLQVMHNGLGTLETQSWSLTTTSTETGLSPSIRAFAETAWAAMSTEIIAVPYPTVAANDYIVLVAGTRLGPTGANVTFDGIENWDPLIDVSSTGNGAPLYWVYGKRADGTETGTVNLTIDKETNSTLAAMRAMMFSVQNVTASDPPYEGIASTGVFISNLTTSQQFEDTDVTTLGENRLVLQIVVHNSQASTFGPFNQPAEAEPTAWTDAFWSSSNVLNIGVHTAEVSAAAVQGGASYESTSASVKIGGFALIGTPNDQIVGSGSDNSFGDLVVEGVGEAEYAAQTGDATIGSLTLGAAAFSGYGSQLQADFGTLQIEGSAESGSSSTAGIGSTLFDGYFGGVFRRRSRVRTAKFTVS